MKPHLKALSRNRISVKRCSNLCLLCQNPFSLVVELSSLNSASLRAETRRLSPEVKISQLINFLPAESPLAFVRGGSGIIGFGEALRLAASGPDRMSQLAQAWRETVSASQVDNQLAWPGSGLVAFGSVAFADESAAESILIVPSLVLGSHDGEVWLTEIHLDGQSGGHSGDGANWAEVFSDHTGEPHEFSADLHSGQISADRFLLNVEAALAELAEGALQKVVIARDAVAELPASFDIRNVLRQLGESYPTCWIYSVDGTFGASPELLVRVSHGQVSARVLAGTAGRGTDPGIDQAISEALVGSAKNLAEHEFAVTSLVESLEPFCSQVDADTSPFSLALPNLWHLASDVHGVLKTGASALDLAAALHPTAAVAGTPRKLALDFIARTEGIDRGRYAAPVGWISANGDGEWAIALRGGQLSETAGSGKTLRAFAGCGVVAGSSPAAELAETHLKFAPIRDALG
jgi:menaquinone-specific isochorismate synthase